MENAQRRQQTILRHLQILNSPSATNFQASLSSSSCSSVGSSDDPDNDVVIVAACRTPICKSKRGSFKDTPAEDLLMHVLKLWKHESRKTDHAGTIVISGWKGVPGILEKTGVSPHEIGDIIVGNVLALGSSRAAECRMAAFYTGFPETIPIKTVNRQCSSGLQAVADVTAAIKSGFYDIGIGAGVESMSLDRGVHKYNFNTQVHSRTNQNAKDCLIPMGITSENVAEQLKVSRFDQDKAAFLSHIRAAEAAVAGKFNDEIVPVHTKVTDQKSGTARSVIVAVDEGIRPDTSLSGLARLKPSFKDGGTTTAGNSSQISDGAASVLLMRRTVALRRRLPILGTFRSFAAVGVKPAVMGIGPAFAIPAAVEAAKLKLHDIDLVEINEAFASQYVYCLHRLGLDVDKVNVNGGAIALGHPVGTTGARCVATLLHEMKRRGKDCRFGVVSMCVGSGMGAAAVFESV